MSSSVDLDSVFPEVLSVVRECGQLIKDNIFSQDKQVEEKENRTDLVTKVDCAVEDLFVKKIQSKYPGHHFIGEESSSQKKEQILQFTEDPTWIIDPIDGTMNFVHSNPMVSISVALAVNRRIELAYVYLPVLDQMYTARKGKGAQLNGKKITVSNCDQFSNAQLMYEVWSANQKSQEIAKFMEIAMSKAHSIRLVGSAAIDLAFVAAGQADAYMHSGIHAWDIAAGALLVREAGGVVRDPTGADFDLMSRKILVAATEKLSQEMIDMKLPYIEYEREFPEKCPM